MKKTHRRLELLLLVLLAPLTFCASLSAGEPATTLRLVRRDYEDRVHAVWAGQIIGMLLAYPFEHRVGSVAWVDDYRNPTEWTPLKEDFARVDDDWYYEIVALRGFEKYGIGMTVEQLGEQWIADSAGSWGSSAETRRLLARGLRPPATGHPRYNPLWYTIGPQFSADIYGALAPGMPNQAAALARRLGHINGYAEGTDGAVFIAGMVSIGFGESDWREIVRKASRLIDPSSPYRQCLDQVVSMAQTGAEFDAVAEAVADRWHPVYPVTNNAVANGGFVAAGVWFGGGDFLKTVNLIARAADFTDADCNAANAGAVVGAMHGTRCLPKPLLERLNDRIHGSQMGPVTFNPPIEERISRLASRTAAVGREMLKASGAAVSDSQFVIPVETPSAQPAELFQLADLMQYWNPQWQLRGAGFGYRGGIRGSTYLDGDVLATYPRDEVRGAALRRTVKLSADPRLTLEAGVDAGRMWRFEAWVDNERVAERLLEGDRSGRKWESIQIDLGRFAGREVTLRLYQFVLVSSTRGPGSAYWKGLELK